jgi:hypothetical protein
MILMLIDRSIGKLIFLICCVYAWQVYPLTTDQEFFFNILSPAMCLLFGVWFLPVSHKKFDTAVDVIGLMFTFNEVYDQLYGEPHGSYVSEIVFGVITITLIIIFSVRRKGGRTKGPGHQYN